MRDIYPEFYINKNKLDFRNLDKGVLIVFDTNILLDLYRSSSKLREELMKTITMIQDNIWMPYQVGYEFHNNRKDLMHEIQIDRDNFIKEIKNKFEKMFNESIDPFKKRNKMYEELIQNHERDFNRVIDRFNMGIDKIDKNIKENKLVDYIDFIEMIFEGKVADNKEYNYLKWQNEAKDRYEELKPPGYKDFKNKKDQYAFINGFRVCKAYGDYFLWKEMLLKSKEDSIKEVIFITNDQKEDWVYESKGRKIGARIELIEEMKRESNANFRIYSTSTLLYHTSSKENYESIENEATNLGKSLEYSTFHDKKEKQLIFSLTDNQSRYNYEKSSRESGEELLLRISSMKRRMLVLNHRLQKIDGGDSVLFFVNSSRIIDELNELSVSLDNFEIDINMAMFVTNPEFTHNHQLTLESFENRLEKIEYEVKMLKYK